MTIFVFSSLFALTACSLSNIYVGLVYSQAGSSYMIDEVASGILSDIASEYGAANADDGTNNWGSLDFASYLGYAGDYISSRNCEVADDFSSFNYYSLKQIDGHYILICSSRFLTQTELGAGDNDGMIVGYEDGQFYLRCMNTTSYNYGSLNITLTYLTTNGNSQTFNSISSNNSTIAVFSNSVYKYVVGNKSSYNPFTAYIFVGDSIGYGTSSMSLSSPQTFLNRFYDGNHAGAIQNDIFSYGSAFSSGSWQVVQMISSVWNWKLSDDEMEDVSSGEDYVDTFVEKYDEYLALLIVKDILVGSSDMSTYSGDNGTAKTYYDAAMQAVAKYVSGTETHANALSATKTFMTYLTNNLGLELYYDSSDTNYIDYSIFSTVIGASRLSLISSTQTATENQRGTVFFKNYVSNVSNFVYSHSGNELNTQSSYLTRGYFLEEDGYSDNLTCKLHSIFFANVNVKTDMFTSADNTMPSFAVFFTAEEGELSKLEDYTFFIYYHKSGDSAIYNVETDDNVIQVTKDADFYTNLENGLLYIDVKAAFEAQKKTLTLNNVSVLGDNPFTAGNVVKVVYNSISTPYFLSNDDTSFDYVELICVPSSSSTFAQITITDLSI